MQRKIAIEIICFLFIVLFLYAAGSKLMEYNKFVGQIGKSPLLTDYAGWIAWLVPLIEIVIAVMLIVPKTRLTGMYAAFGMMVIFTFYIIVILTISRELPCSCGGILSMLGWKEHLVFNIWFVLLGFAGIYLLGKPEDKEVITQHS